MSCDPRKDLCHAPGCDDFNQGGMSSHCEAHDPLAPLGGRYRSVRPGRTYAVPDSDVACADELREHLVTCETCRMGDDRVELWCVHGQDLACALGRSGEPDPESRPFDVVGRVLNQARGIALEQHRRRATDDNPPITTQSLSWTDDQIFKFAIDVTRSYGDKALDKDFRRQMADSKALSILMLQQQPAIPVASIRELTSRLRRALGVS